MIHCKELNKDFNSKEDMFKELRLYKDDIIAIKKANILKSIDKDISVTAKPLDYLKLSTQSKEIPLDDNYYYIAVNATRVLDSHKDLHLDGIWNKTKKEQQGKNYLVADHQLGVLTTVAKKEYVEMFTAVIPFSMIGKSYPGDTEALIYKVRKDKIINQIAKEWLDSGDAIQASVRMQYVDIILALNSSAKEDKKEKKNFDDLYPIIANKDEFEDEIMYFWGVKQAKNVLESSLVLFGSCDATGQISLDNKQEPLENTQINNEPPQGTQKSISEMIKETKILN